MSGMNRPVRYRAWRFIAALNVLAVVAHAQDSLPVRVPDRAEPVIFETEVLPILKSNCLACHSASESEGDLVLESPASIAQGGISGSAIVPGKSKESLLFQAAAHMGDVVMPPEGNAVGAENLSPEELGLLKLWIDHGARASGSADEASLEWRPLPAELDPIYAVAMTPDGRYVAAGLGNRLRVYQIATRRLVGELIDPALGQELVSTNVSEATMSAAHLDLVQSLDFSPDAARLASGGFRTVKIWRKVPARVERATSEAAENLTSSEVTGGWTVAWQGNVVQLNDAESGQVVRSFDLGRPISFAAVAPDGSRIVALGAGGPGKLWDAASGAVVAELYADAALRERVAAAAYALTVRERQRDYAQRDVDAAKRRKTEAEETLATAHKELEAAEAALAEKRKVEQEKAQAGGSDAQAAKTEREAAERNVAAAKEAVALNEPVVQRAHQDVQAAAAAFEDAKESVAVAAQERDRLQKVLGEGRVELALAAFSPDAAEVAAVDAGGTLQTFAASDGSPLEQLMPCTENPTDVRYVAATRVRVITKNGVYDVDTPPRWELERTIGAWDDPGVLADRVTALDFSPDGKLLAAGSGEPSRTGQIRLFDIETGLPVRDVADVHSDAVLSVAFSPDGERLVGGGADRFGRIFGVADGRLRRNLEGHTGHVAAVAWHADGRTLATASADGTIKVWDSRSGEQQKTIDGFNGPLSDVAFLGADDMLVVTGGKNLVAGRKTDGSGGPGFAGMAGFVHSISVSQDGRLIVAAGEEGRVHVWQRDGTVVAVLPPE